MTLSTSSSTTNFQFEATTPFQSFSSDSEIDEEYLSPAYAQLLTAITNGNLGMVKQMVEYGLNVNYIYDREQNYSFLHLACLMGHSKVIKYLIDVGADSSLVTFDGHQPIDFIESDDLNTISYMLLKMGTNMKRSESSQ